MRMTDIYTRNETTVAVSYVKKSIGEKEIPRGLTRRLIYIKLCASRITIWSSLYVEILTMIGRKRICSARANDN